MKEAKDGAKEALILGGEVGSEEESVRVQKLLWILDERCSGKGDHSIVGGRGRAREEIFLRFCVKVGRVELKMSDELRNALTY